MMHPFSVNVQYSATCSSVITALLTVNWVVDYAQLGQSNSCSVVQENYSCSRINVDIYWHMFVRMQEVYVCCVAGNFKYFSLLSNYIMAAIECSKHNVLRVKKKNGCISAEPMLWSYQIKQGVLLETCNNRNCSLSTPRH